MSKCIYFIYLNYHPLSVKVLSSSGDLSVEELGLRQLDWFCNLGSRYAEKLLRLLELVA